MDVAGTWEATASRLIMRVVLSALKPPCSLPQAAAKTGGGFMSATATATAPGRETYPVLMPWAMLSALKPPRRW